MSMDHVSVRQRLRESIVAELMGPGSEYPVEVRQFIDVEDELISENPLQRYSVGILYEQIKRSDEEDDSSAGEVGKGDAQVDELLDIATTTANQYYPSSIGMSFYISGLNPALSVTIRAAIYRRVTPDECRVLYPTGPQVLVSNSEAREHVAWRDGELWLKQRITRETRQQLIDFDSEDADWVSAVYRLYELQQNGWRRIPLTKTVGVEPGTESPGTSPFRFRESVCEGLELVGVHRPEPEKRSTLVTLALVNGFKGEAGNKGRARKRPENSFFQVGFSVTPKNADARFLDYEKRVRRTRKTKEHGISTELLYRNRQVLGVGHGCALTWDSDGTSLQTEIIPTYEVPGITFNVSELRTVEYVLSMKALSDLSSLSREEICDTLSVFVRTYREWIETKQQEIIQLDESLRSVATRHLDECEQCAARLVRGISILRTDDMAFRAFQLANRAMLMQRVHSELVASRDSGAERGPLWPDYERIPDTHARWRPFQLAFLLLNIASMLDPESPEREIVDLIWFPTGGGKTEAYLGVTAFCIFLRRLRDPVRGAGTAIMMRYTLRLLTSQQFQRASTLICACERIRLEQPDVLGREPIGIGLWVGGDSSPNTLADAAYALDELVVGRTQRNPFQVLQCPWCGTSLEGVGGGDGESNWGYRIVDNPRRLRIFCTEPSCFFHQELPIKVVDDDIYRQPPTLLFGTVDKFAMLPWKAEAGNLFGLNRDVFTPELIIQDELHLIAGPLGTMVGLYEAAIDLLCSSKGIKPKIIASTATITNADEQVHSLYDRRVAVFPPPGIDAEDSFFSREAPLSQVPGRQYVGLMATGTTLATAQVVLMSAILQSVQDLAVADEAKDPYWTLVTYFNTIRELGRTSTLALDDIKDRIRRLARRWGTKSRIYHRAEELTGSRQSADIPTMLRKMALEYPNKDAIDILLTTNMISVGVDIDRLGLMLVVSQPKTTAEYIQATSRAGRKFPGLIVTLYDGARPRDRSHYERFVAYHQSFYQYVEPTSLTPFSEPARTRGLHAVLVSVVRHVLGLKPDGHAAAFDRSLDGLSEVVEQIVERATSVMADEGEGTRRDLEQFIRNWEAIARSNEALTYSNASHPRLLYPAGLTNARYFPTMQSMRSVDASGNLRVDF